jgi:hypothetical protein
LIGGNTVRIAIISDTHGSSNAFKKAVEVAGACDYFLHAGDILYHGPRNPLPAGYNPKELADAINTMDIPFIAAAGNCDAPIDQVMLSVPIQAPYALLCLEKFRILVTHGHDTTEEELIALAKKWRINFVVTGHTHVKRVEKREGLTLVNPGSCALPKDGVPSIAVIEDSKIRLLNIETGEIIKSEVV